MICKQCLHHRVCPHLKDEDAEKCKAYADKDDYVKVVRCKDCSHRTHDGWCKIQARNTSDGEYCNLAREV